MNETLPVVVIAGRPNVGKSTLFNKLAGRRSAIVSDISGVTRDRKEAEGTLRGRRVCLVDTAGLEESAPETMAGRMRASSEVAVGTADLILFVVDARAGITPADRHFVAWLRRQGRPILLVANKAEGRAGATTALEAYSLGLGDPVAVSAEHGEGLSDLMSEIADRLPEPAPEAEDAGRPLKLAIVGRPNAGKSTLVNRLIGEERLLTGPEAGITRDAIPVDWTYQGREVRLVDTAGLRRKARVQEVLEKLSTADTIRAITFAEVVILVMDADNAFETQDLQIADLVEREGRGLVFCLAKWDLVEEPQARLAELRATAEGALPQVRGTPLIALSAETGRGVDALMPAVFGVHKNWSTKVKTRDLNDWLAMAVQRHPPPAVDGRRIKPKYMAQTKARPPTFVLFASRAQHLPDQYRRYLINSLRESFDLPGVPIRVNIRANKNPYADEADGHRSVAAPRYPVAKKVAAPRSEPAMESTSPITAARAKQAADPAQPAAAKPVRKAAGKPVARAGFGKPGFKALGKKTPLPKAKGGRAAQRTPTTHKLRKDAPRRPR